MKKIFFQKCSLNYIFFLLYFVANFISLNLRMDFPEENIAEEENIYNSSALMINIYLMTLSNFLGIIPFCLLKRSSKGKIYEADNKLNEKEINSALIYNNIDINANASKTKKNLIYGFLVAFFEFIANFTILLFYIIFPKLSPLFYSVNCTVVYSVIIQFILSYFLLKMHFYKLQKFTLIINIIIFFVLLIFDLINIIIYEAFNGEIYGFYFLMLTFFAIEYTYVKKAFLEGFLSPYKLLILRGIYMVILSLIFSVISFFIDKRIFINMPYFFLNVKYILRSVGFFIFNFFKDLFSWIIIDRFSPNYLPLCFILDDISFYVSNFEKH